MPRSSGQKQKILILARYLLEESDESHPLTMGQILAHLSAMGISAERKSVYADLEELRTVGLDVICTKQKNTGYFIGERRFQLPEVRLLVDAVQSSRFLTEKKSEELIGKLQSLVSRHEAKTLARNVFVSGRIKNMNESIYRNVDTISAAIEGGNRIRFSYFEWDKTGAKRLRRQEEGYEAQPRFLLWDHENYYLVAFDSGENKIKHFRVDKMLRIQLLPDRREGKDSFKRFDMGAYSNKMFGMFSGEEETVKILCRNELAGVMIDRFGKDVMMVKVDTEHFYVNVKVAVSRQFLAWVIALGDGAKIIGPESVVLEVKKEIERLVGQYDL